MNNRGLVAPLCKALQPLTQNSVITAQTAGIIVSAYLKGDEQPLADLTKRRDIPVVFMPMVQEIKEKFTTNKEGLKC